MDTNWVLASTSTISRAFRWGRPGEREKERGASRKLTTPAPKKVITTSNMTLSGPKMNVQFNITTFQYKLEADRR